MNTGGVMTAPSGGSINKWMCETSASSKTATSPSRINERAGRCAIAPAISANRLVWSTALHRPPADSTNVAPVLEGHDAPAVVLLLIDVSGAVEWRRERWLNQGEASEHVGGTHPRAWIACHERPSGRKPERCQSRGQPGRFSFTFPAGASES